MSGPATRTIPERSEQNISDTSRLVALGELAGGVAHNFGNVLMGVSVTLELLQMRAAREPGLTDMLETIDGAQAEVGKAAEIIQRLLALSRGNPFVITSVNPCLAANNAIALCATHTNAKRVRILNLIPQGAPNIEADASRLEEILVNLILNALQASDEGTVRVSLADDGDRVKIMVADNGCGISPEDMEKLFDPFFTRRKGGSGTGVGLPCSANQVSRMGGTIEVESDLGVGSTFTITLPKWTES